ncbi:MAG: hypothetical protein Q4G03_06215 [Planctomycetia bacterium]|nr:hypothetical protein [Planctomycetia bacterium]
MTYTTKIRRDTLRFATRRRAVTLVEIMASVMVLAVGLVGVLAAIPFGGMRMSQMNEADRSAELGATAAEFMDAYNWADPDNWKCRNNVGVTSFLYSDDTLKRSFFMDSGVCKYNLRYPYLVDPLGANNAVEFIAMTPSGGSNVFFTRLSPLFPGDYEVDNALIERTFYLTDDFIQGDESDEDGTQLRPRLEMEDDNVLSDGVYKVKTQAFSGRYSWMSCVYLKSTDEPFQDCTKSGITLAEYDTVAFQDRDFGNELAFTCQLQTSGYQGGTFDVDLTSVVNNSGADDFDEITISRFLDQLTTTRCLMIYGDDDVAQDASNGLGAVTRTPLTFARWYRIASYAVTEYNNYGVPTNLRLTVIGPNMPNNWTSNTASILFFPGAIDVYRGSKLL